MTPRNQQKYQDLIKFNGEGKCNGLHKLVLAKLTSMNDTGFETLFYVIIYI